MKKTWIRIIAFVLLICLLPALLLTVGASLPILYGNSYYAELAPLTERLDQSEGKKLVLIGGSNIAFGVDVDLLEQLLAEKGYSYTVCPYGLYAAVGCSAMLSLSENALKEGDLVVLAVEPTDETMSAYFGASAFLKCAEDAPWLLARMNAEQRWVIMSHICRSACRSSAPGSCRKRKVSTAARLSATTAILIIRAKATLWLSVSIHPSRST